MLSFKNSRAYSKKCAKNQVSMFWWDYMIKKINNKKAYIIWTVGTFYSSVIKHVHIFEGMIWHMQQNVVKCFIIPLPRFSYIYWLIHFNLERYLALVISWLLSFSFGFGTNSYLPAFCRIAILKNFTKVVEKHLWWSFLIKVSGCGLSKGLH